jgi:methylase of polypeptide subunit release factors
MFPEGKAPLIVCNPPWLPAKPSSPIEFAIYDHESVMLLAFLNGLKTHLTDDGEGWLIMSDFAEHLGLRDKDELRNAIEQAGLYIEEKLDIKPKHGKVMDKTDRLHQARNAEVTSLWRLKTKQ